MGRCRILRNCNSGQTWRSGVESIKTIGRIHSQCKPVGVGVGVGVGGVGMFSIVVHKMARARKWETSFGGNRRQSLRKYWNSQKINQIRFGGRPHPPIEM
jgi:hypothetical protein